MLATSCLYPSVIGPWAACVGFRVALNRMKQFSLRYAAPQALFPMAGKAAPFFSVLAVLLAMAGLYVGFFVWTLKK